MNSILFSEKKFLFSNLYYSLAYTRLSQEVPQFFDETQVIGWAMIPSLKPNLRQVWKQEITGGQILGKWRLNEQFEAQFD